MKNPDPALEYLLSVLSVFVSILFLVKKWNNEADTEKLKGMYVTSDMEKASIVNSTKSKDDIWDSIIDFRVIRIRAWHSLARYDND